MRNIGLSSLLLIIFVGALPVSASPKFAYTEINQIYVITDAEAILYAEFPAFVKFRSIITQTMKKPCVVKPEKDERLYKVRLISEVEHRFVYIGDSWIRYNGCYASLSELDYDWIVDSIAHGKDQRNATLEMYNFAMNRLLEKQGNPPVTGL